MHEHKRVVDPRSLVTQPGLESLSVDLRELQQKVADFETILYRPRRDLVRLDERQLDEFDSVPPPQWPLPPTDLVARVEAVDAALGTRHDRRDLGAMGEA